MPFRRIAAPCQTPLMARNAILMRLQTAILPPAMAAHRQQIVHHQILLLLQHVILRFRLPPQRQVGRADHLHEIHVVERRVVGALVRVVQGIGMVVRPGHLLARAERLRDAIRDLGPEAQVVDRVREGMCGVIRRVEVVVQVVDVHRAVAEAAPGGDVEVPHHLVHAEAALDAAALLALRVEFLAVVLPLALLDVLAFAEGPADAGVGLAHLFAGGAAAGFLDGRWGWGAVAVAAVVRGEVGGGVVAVEVQGGDLEGQTALGGGRELHF